GRASAAAAAAAALGAADRDRLRHVHQLGLGLLRLLLFLLLAVRAVGVAVLAAVFAGLLGRERFFGFGRPHLIAQRHHDGRDVLAVAVGAAPARAGAVRGPHVFVVDGGRRGVGLIGR